MHLVDIVMTWSSTVWSISEIYGDPSLIILVCETQPYKSCCSQWWLSTLEQLCHCSFCHDMTFHQDINRYMTWVTKRRHWSVWGENQLGTLYLCHLVMTHPCHNNGMYNSTWPQEIVAMHRQCMGHCVLRHYKGCSVLVIVSSIVFSCHLSSQLSCQLSFIVFIKTLLVTWVSKGMTLLCH